MSFERLLSTRKSIYIEFLIIFLIALLARGNGIFGLAWNCDDLLNIYDKTGIGYANSQASQLRFFASLTTRFIGWLGAGFPPLGAFWSASHTAAMVVFALALRKLWIPRSPSIYGILIGLLITLFPYNINLLAYQLQHPSMTMSYLTGAYGIANYNKMGWWRWTSILAIAASLSYQTMISYFVAAGLILVLIQLYRHLSSSEQASLAADMQPVVDYAKLIGLGIVTYLILSLLTVRLFGLSASDRATLAGPEDVRNKIQLLINHLKRTAFGREQSMTRAPKLLQSLLWVVVSFGLFKDLLRRRDDRSSAFIFLPLVIAISMLTIAAAFLPTILMHHTSENPRNLMATIIFGAGFLSLASLLRSRRLKIIALSLACLIALSYAINTNKISVDIARLANRDFLNASLMVERINLLRGPSPVRTIAFLGTYSPNHGLQGREYFQSAFEVDWAKLPLLTEATGQVFSQPTQTDLQKANAIARNRPAWPANGSVLVDGDLGVIVLSKPEAARN